jgi:hypothetical protein
LVSPFCVGGLFSSVNAHSAFQAVLIEAVHREEMKAITSAGVRVVSLLDLF